MVGRGFTPDTPCPSVLKSKSRSPSPFPLFPPVKTILPLRFGSVAPFRFLFSLP